MILKNDRKQFDFSEEFRKFVPNNLIHCEKESHFQSLFIPFVTISCICVIDLIGLPFAFV